MKGILKNLHRYVLWLTVSFFFWAWIFTLITDAPAEKKLLLYADLPAMEREALSAELEKDMPEGIRFVESRVFSDEMFQPANLGAGDVFIVAASRAEALLGTFSPVDRNAFLNRPLYEADDQAYGVCVFDEGAGVRCGTKYLAYVPGETYYLFFNVKSRHLGAWNGSADDAALRAARTFLDLP